MDANKDRMPLKVDRRAWSKAPMLAHDQTIPDVLGREVVVVALDPNEGVGASYRAVGGSGALHRG